MTEQDAKKPVVYVKPSKLTGGEVWEGTYVRTHEAPSLFDDGKTMSTHYFEADDTIYGINGAAQLNAIMKKAAVGKRYSVEYTGKESIIRKNGKTVDAHTFNLQDA
jgi:hypothetical protein